jgi:hypothetical protein
MIKIDFEFETEHGVFRDALYLNDSHSFSDAQIEGMKQERLTNWLAIVASPPVEEASPEYIEIDGVQYVKVV